MALPDSKIKNAIDGSGNPIGNTVYVNEDTSSYKSVNSTLTTSTEFDFYTQLGRMATAGYIINDDINSNTLVVAFSVDGAIYGDDINILPGEEFRFNIWVAFKRILLRHTVDIDFRMVAR